MASPQVYIGVDIGTSGCRAIVVGEDGRTLAAAVRTYPLHTPAPGWVEQDPRDWIAGAFAVIAEVCASGAFEPADVRGVGVDGQSWACVPVAEDGTVLANTPIWMDMRSQPICDELLAAVPADELLAVGGNRLSPSYSTAKALWFERNRPDVFARARWFLQCNSAVVMALTGVASQDHSQGYGWHFIDVATGRIRGDLARRLGIDPGRVPDPVEPSAVVGGVTADAARATGLPTGTPVVAGGLDAACGTLGAGVFRPGQTQEQGGQAGGMSIAMDAPVADERLILSRHVVPGSWLLQGGTVAGSASLAWLARIVGEAERAAAESSGRGLYEEVSALAATAPPGCDGLVFLPYLSGERSPIWDAGARGAFVGLTLGTDRAHLYRAVMEGVAFALRHNLEVAASAGAEVSELLAIGGASRSPLWMQIKADVTRTPLTVSANPDATPLGAAMLAALGTGAGTVDDLIGRWVGRGATYTPDEARAESYDALYRVYAGLYPALAASMHDLAAVGRTIGSDA
ncbi:MAG: FGGY-family carbohydrate kinase [Propionibacteriaceae bacterium]|nr:FGGY-family carbohydrate kinase [Propionibacteriaceae bacterium]